MTLSSHAFLGSPPGWLIGIHSVNGLSSAPLRETHHRHARREHATTFLTVHRKIPQRVWNGQLDLVNASQVKVHLLLTNRPEKEGHRIEGVRVPVARDARVEAGSGRGRKEAHPMEEE